MLQIGAVLFWRFAGRGEIDSIGLSRDPACEGEDWPHTRWKFCSDDSERLRLVFRHFRCAALSVERSGESFLKGGFSDERSRQPNACRSRSFEDFDARRDFERAPMVNRCPRCKKWPNFCEREAC